MQAKGLRLDQQCILENYSKIVGGFRGASFSFLLCFLNLYVLRKLNRIHSGLWYTRGHFVQEKFKLEAQRRDHLGESREFRQRQGSKRESQHCQAVEYMELQ